MRILELEMHEVRGIRSLRITPGGKNFAVLGQNGTGKSAVIDAIDFLLTGKMSRLMGAGTAGITLKRYGPHIDADIDADPDASYVSATVLIPGIKEPIELTRRLSKPDELQYDKSLTPRVAPILELARRGQHVLTRREILRYITAEASTRAEKIQDLLNISDIENIRRSLVKVQTTANNERKGQDISLRETHSAVSATLHTESFDEGQLLEIVNRNRKILGGQPVTEPKSAIIQTEITLPKSVKGEQIINVTLVEKDVRSLEELDSQKHRQTNAELDGQLRALLLAIRSDPKTLRALSRLQLFEMGISLIDDSGACPLCDTVWPQGELAVHLKEHVATAQAALANQEKIDEVSEELKASSYTAIAHLEKLISSLKQAELEAFLPPLQKWRDALAEFNQAISDPLSKYPSEQFSVKQVESLFSTPETSALLTQALSKLHEKYPESSPEQTAWDTLTILTANLKSLEKAQESHRNSILLQSRADTLLESFLKARDEVLGKLYDEIASRFSELYRGIHGPDEKSFGAEIRPEGAGLSFKVDFYGRGMHPPQALHSEGHQDSMGLCLYLALAERLTQGLIDLVILDDVVMSVDSNHRRMICNLLSQYFPDKQFIITTHDKTWANELKSEGVIHSRELLEFYNWTVDTGPLVNYEPDMWARLDTYLESNNISQAAALLRRGLEAFFSYACDALAAKVEYRLDGRNDLGDFLPAAMGQYLSLLKKAKNSAQSWQRQDLFKQCEELNSRATEIYKQTNAEQWAINANVHFNNWANFSKEDFVPVVKALKNLQSLFICPEPKCESVIKVVRHELEIVGVRCKCGHIDWNLETKDN